MDVGDTRYQTIWVHPYDRHIIQIIDQRHLPFQFVVEDLARVEDVYIAIKEMHVRGAPLIGVTAAFGMYLAILQHKDSTEYIDTAISKAADYLISARPTAVNLKHAVNMQKSVIQDASSIQEKTIRAYNSAIELWQMELDACENIGIHGFSIIEKIAIQKKDKPVNILTHCNAGWLACVDYGTATAPIYTAHDKGINIHVWVDETRPRNQGASLTAWELFNHGVPHTVIVDNAGGHLMQHGMVDMVIVGSDRTTIRGDVANKIGTYLKALAAYDNNIPFYVALPSSTIDRDIMDGLTEIPIEQRNPDEVKYMKGLAANNTVTKILLTPQNTPALNYGFDVTPAKYVSGLITERGICEANENSIYQLFPEFKKS